MADILIVNQSRLLSQADILPVIAAINKQIAGDFAPVWGTAGELYFGSAPLGTTWIFTLQDTIDDANALGYHTDENGAVTAIIDVAECKASGDDWRTCLGHEVLEALADPLCTRLGVGAFADFMVEVADAVEEDSYVIDGVPITNFVTPAYFGFNLSGVYDKCGYLTGPAPALRPGGYIEQLVNGAWQQHLGERAQVRPGYMASRSNGRRAWRKRVA